MSDIINLRSYIDSSLAKILVLLDVQRDCVADSPAPEAAGAFLTFVADPSRQAQWKATGFESIAMGK